MVAGKHYTSGTANWNPTGCLQGLCRLVDEQSAELHAVEQTVGTANKCAGDDSCLAEYLVAYAQFEFYVALLHSFKFLVECAVTALAVGTQLAYRLPYAP